MIRKIQKMAVAAICGLFAIGARAADTVLQTILTTDRAPYGSEVELGVWNADIDECVRVARETGIPMIGVWSREGCAHCQILEKAITSDVFREWVKNSGLILGFSSSLDDQAGKELTFTLNGETKTAVMGDGGVRQGTANATSNLEAYPCGYSGNGRYWKWCKGPSGEVKDYPEVRFFWYKDGKKVVDFGVKGDTVDGQQGIYQGSYNKAGQKVIDYITEKSGFASYLANPKALNSYMGGTFALEETDGNRFEAEEGTTEVTVELVRTEAAAAVATNHTIQVIGPDGKAVATNTVEWAANEASKKVTLDISGVKFTENGQKAYLVAVDPVEGTAVSSNSVTYVTGNSAVDPLWIGEKTTDELDFGEWTMDLDVAKAKVAAAETNAYTLVAIEGSLWCHDCANTERNFTGVKDDKSESKFAAWAKKNNVALVSLDVRSGDGTGPTLLSRTAYSTTLAYENANWGIYDVSQAGADASLTNAMYRSGLGYLTRKGISDEDAAAADSNIVSLVSTELADGGFHLTGVDSRAYRTGVPIYVLLDKTGAPVARMTTFASVSPLASAKAQFDNIIKRFDEMLAIADNVDGHGDGAVWQDDTPALATAMTANGGIASGELSHVDYQDFFKLDGITGNALQKTTVIGDADVEVIVEYGTASNGVFQRFASASGNLADGVSLEETFGSSAGSCYLRVSVDRFGDDFGVANSTANNFAAYAVSGTTVLVPGEDAATSATLKGKNTVVMRLENGQLYRIQGINPTANSVLVPEDEDDPYNLFFTAALDDDTEDCELVCQNADITVTYQKWSPGVVAFKVPTATVREDSGTNTVTVSRTGGSSGAVSVKIYADLENSDIDNTEGDDNFIFEEQTLSWDDGETDDKTVTVYVANDGYYDGQAQLVLKMEKTAESATEVDEDATFTLIATEVSKADPGKVAIVGVDPFYSKKLTVYAKEDAGATIYIGRIGSGSDGDVDVTLSSSLSGVTFGGDALANKVTLPNHKTDWKSVTVEGVPAGKSARVTISKPTNGATLQSGSNTVTVVSVASDAPEFAKQSVSETLYRYVMVSNRYEVSGAPEGAKLVFTKLYGTLPAGLSVKADNAGQAMVVAGTPTKAGSFDLVYQVTSQVGTKKTPGLTINIKYTIVDPTDAKGEEGTYNEAIADGGNSRTFNDIPVVDVEGKRMPGTLNVTIPKTGKISARYNCAAGAVSFSAKGWNGFDPETAALAASLTSTKKGYSIELAIENDGQFTAYVTDPDSEAVLEAYSYGKLWSKTDNAADWKGYYTVALVNSGVEEEVAGMAPRGHGYLTLKMSTTSAYNTGKVTWAGMMPNGKAVSGTSVLGSGDICEGGLAIFKRTTTDVVSILVNIHSGAQEKADEDGTCQAVFSPEAVESVWRHVEKNEKACYTVKFGVYGGIYKSTANLADEFADPDRGYNGSPYFYADTTDLAQETFNIAPGEVAGIAATLTTASVTLASGGRFSFTPSTGVASGTVAIPYTDAKGVQRTMNASWKGVVLLGWGPGCECGDDVSGTTLPFMLGSFYFNDKATLDAKSVSVTRGGPVALDAEIAE